MSRICRYIALLVLALPAQAFAVPFSAVHVLGDSLSDQGNLFLGTSAIAGPANALPSPDHYFNGRFSNGPIYIDVLAQSLGVPSGPSLLGGNNFAFGGARTAYNTVETTVGGPFPPSLFPWSLNAEIAAFSSRGVVDANALYIVFSGSNDVADILTRSLNPAVVIPNAVSGILAAVQVFKNAGAQIIVVPNVPDLGLTPAFLGNPAAASAATFLSTQFNSLLHAQLAAITGVDIIEFDTFGFLREVVNNAASFGLTNVTGPCYSGFVGPNPAGTECANPDEFLFWDIVHPTRVTHALLANELLAVIPSGIVPEPSTLPLFVLSILFLGVVRRMHEVSAIRCTADVQCCRA
jgi:outer membrane lipase/esterase